MPQLLTVRWPLFARLEAVLFFPLAVVLAHELDLVRTIVDRHLVPVIAPYAARLDVSKPGCAWLATAVVALAPYLLMLIVADRVLTVRKGYALLSLAAIAVWAAAAAHLSARFAVPAGALPGRLSAGALPDMLSAGALHDRFSAGMLPDRLSISQWAALFAGTLAFLAHIVPLWIGLRDQGDVAQRLIVRGEETRHDQNHFAEPRRPQDVYQRRIAEFREWRSPDQINDLAETTRAYPAVRFLSLLTWAGVIIGAAFVWHNWNNMRADHDAAGPPAVALAPTAAAPPTIRVVDGSMPGGAMPGGSMPGGPMPGGPMPGGPMPGGPMPGGPMSGGPMVPGFPPTGPMAGKPLPLRPVPLAQPVAATALPAVQHPGTPMLPTVQTPSFVPPSSANQAMAERGRDGGFSFDAVVNGTHVPMIFDTGATVVAIRGEDAERVGIDTSQLSYSVRVKTANGITEVAPVLIETLTIGEITQRDVAGYVARRGALHTNLLGQSFLARLSGFDVQQDHLVLRGH